MVNDLYKSHKELLYDFIRLKKYVRTSEVIRFACDHYSNRGDRDARLLAKEGRIRRMRPEKKAMLFPNVKTEEIWEILPWTNVPITQR